MGLPEIKNPVDNFLETRLRKVRNDATYRPVIDAVKAANHKGITSNELLDVAVAATRDEFKREGKTAKGAEVRDRALVAALAASTETGIQLADLPEGTDKTEHFLASGVLSAKASGFFDKFLPKSWSEKIGYGISMAFGYAKEINDKFFGTGYDRDDLKADRAGAKRPFEMKG